jgi:hypothetical protein
MEKCAARQDKGAGLKPALVFAPALRAIFCGMVRGRRGAPVRAPFPAGTTTRRGEKFFAPTPPPPAHSVPYGTVGYVVDSVSYQHGVPNGTPRRTKMFSPTKETPLQVERSDTQLGAKRTLVDLRNAIGHTQKKRLNNCLSNRSSVPSRKIAFFAKDTRFAGERFLFYNPSCFNYELSITNYDFFPFSVLRSPFPVLPFSVFPRRCLSAAKTAGNEERTKVQLETTRST